MKKALLILLLLAGITGTARATTLTSKPATDSVYICQSKSAYAYHLYQCRGLARCTHGIARITKAQAIKLGYKACKICY